jgi:hypothetical protein
MAVRLLLGDGADRSRSTQFGLTLAHRHPAHASRATR